MMAIPVDAPEDWTAFYTAVATVSGSLIGLLFVSLSVRIEILRTTQHRDLRDLALQTFTDFLAVLVMALLLLVPHLPPGVLALTVGSLSLRGIARIATRTWALRHHGNAARFVIARFSFSLVGHLTMLFSAVRTLHPSLAAGYANTLLVAPMMLLMMSGSYNAIHLLFREAEAPGTGPSV